MTWQTQEGIRVVVRKEFKVQNPEQAPRRDSGGDGVESAGTMWIIDCRLRYREGKQKGTHLVH